MSKVKATHRGTCQACGALQKLPNGRLSVHGYTVKWSCFTGICQGSDVEPFEISKDLIESCIASAERGIVSVKAEQARIRALVAPIAIVAYTCGGGYKHQQETEISHETQERNGHTFHTFTFVDFRKQIRKVEHFQLNGFFDNLEAACASLNGIAANRLNLKLSELNSYIKWQRERINGWKPTPSNLKPIKP